VVAKCSLRPVILLPPLGGVVCVVDENSVVCMYVRLALKVEERCTVYCASYIVFVLVKGLLLWKPLQ
jgi:hypothetical protein